MGFDVLIPKTVLYLICWFHLNAAVEIGHILFYIFLFWNKADCIML